MTGCMVLLTGRWPITKRGRGGGGGITGGSLRYVKPHIAPLYLMRFKHFPQSPLHNVS